MEGLRNRQYRERRADVTAHMAKLFDLLDRVWVSYQHGDAERAEDAAAQLENVARELSIATQDVCHILAWSYESSERSAQ